MHIATKKHQASKADFTQKNKIIFILKSTKVKQHEASFIFIPYICFKWASTS